MSNIQDTLAALIRTVSACELEVEKARHGIKSLVGDFPEKAFNLLDNNGSGFITVSEICEFLKNFGVDVTDDEIRTIVKYYDCSGKRRLGTEDFIRAITPRQDNTGPKKREEREVDLALVRFFVKEFELLRKTATYRRQFSDTGKWSTLDAYNCIDSKGRGSFTHSELDAFLQRHAVSLSGTECFAAFYRMDLDNKKKVTYPDLQRNLFFEEPSKERSNPPPTNNNREKPQQKSPINAFDNFSSFPERQEKPKSSNLPKEKPAPSHLGHHDDWHHASTFETPPASNNNKPTSLHHSSSDRDLHHRDRDYHHNDVHHTPSSYSPRDYDNHRPLSPKMTNSTYIRPSESTYIRPSDTSVRPSADTSYIRPSSTYVPSTLPSTHYSPSHYTPSYTSTLRPTLSTPYDYTPSISKSATYPSSRLSSIRPLSSYEPTVPTSLYTSSVLPRYDTPRTYDAAPINFEKYHLYNDSDYVSPSLTTSALRDVSPRLSSYSPSFTRSTSLHDTPYYSKGTSYLSSSRFDTPIYPSFGSNSLYRSSYH